MTARLEVVDPISPEEASAPAEQEKQLRFGMQLAEALHQVTCKEHGPGAKSWHVGVEMRMPETVRDRFYVTIDIDAGLPTAMRYTDIGPISADITNHCLVFVESGIEAKLPGCDIGSSSREVTDLSQH